MSHQLTQSKRFKKFYNNVAVESVGETSSIPDVEPPEESSPKEANCRKKFFVVLVTMFIIIIAIASRMADRDLFDFQSKKFQANTSISPKVKII